MASKQIMYRGLGRRKSATARIILRPGKGKVTINGLPELEYLKSKIFVQDIAEPLLLTDNTGKFDISINTRGGGLSGQTKAIRLGVARALLEVNPDFRPKLKAHKMLSRDPRVKERKKPGLRKARKARQFSKR